MTLQEKEQFIRNGEMRIDAAYRLALAYGLPEDEAGDLQDFYHNHSTECLTTCDRCVRNYHIHRKTWLKELHG